jgi:hypothetical protein
MGTEVLGLGGTGGGIVLNLGALGVLDGVEGVEKRMGWRGTWVNADFREISKGISLRTGFVANKVRGLNKGGGRKKGSDLIAKVVKRGYNANYGQGKKY